ncbi:MAG TPA: serine/threonine-protein kinase [Fimbriiglobus sp.]|nr:serine/threonine-protein kinase [Fimbriiglobus sp.]
MSSPTDTEHECPCPADLGGLLRGELPDQRQAQLSEHVGDCACCQERMEALATGGDPVAADCVRHIDRATPPSDSAYWRALNQAEAAVTRSYGGLDLASSGEVKLDFLQPSDRPGHLGRLSMFEVSRVLGRGGMGVVLQGFDESLEREVALKVLDPQLASNDLARQRFCREARSAAQVSHDNLVAVHQVAEDETSGLPFLVMQLVNGESLDQRLRRVGRLSVCEVVRIGMQTAAGLAAAHSQGLIHRDIKPGNILIEAGTEKVKLTDFGLAKATEDLRLTRSGFVAGTPLYMAPEQARGDEVDARADLFSLGSVLYEALAGKPPFEGKTPLAVLRRVADEAHPRLRKVNPEVPGWLEETIDRLLEKEPRDRFQSASDVTEVFAGHLSELGILSPLEVEAPCGMVRSSPRSPRARRKVCMRTLVAMATVFLAGGVVGGIGVLEFAPRPAERIEAVPVRPVLGGAQPVDSGPKSKFLLPGKAGAILSAAITPDGKTLATGIESGQISIWDVAGQKRRFDLHPPMADQQPAHRGLVWAVDFSADGTKLVSASDDGAVKVWDVATGNQIKNLAVGTSVRSAAVSPSGSWVALGDRFGTVRVFDLTEDKPILEYPQESTVNGVAFTRDGMTLASAGTDGSVIIYDIPGNRKRYTLTGRHSGPVYGLAFSPDGERLATAGWDHNVVVWDTRTGTALKTIRAHDEGVWAVTFAPCGKVLATVGQDGKIKVWDVADGKELAQFGGHRGTVHVIRFNADGSQLITGGRDGDVRVWDTDHCKVE